MTLPKLSLRALAKLLHVSEGAVRKAVKTGRLRRSVGRGPDGRPVIVDAVLAAKEWTENAAGPPPERQAHDLDAGQVEELVYLGLGVLLLEHCADAVLESGPDGWPLTFDPRTLLAGLRAHRREFSKFMKNGADVDAQEVAL